MKMKKFLLIIMILLSFVSLVSAEEREEGEADSKVFFFGEVWSSADYYTAGDAEFEAEAFASAEGDVNSDWIWYASLQATTGSIERNGADIFVRDGEVPLVSLREAYISSDSWRIGKQVFADEASVKFDFISLNLFETRDLSRPFSALDEDRRLGNGAVARVFLDGRLKLVAAMAEPPIIATDEDDPWTRQLPQGFRYGSIKNDADYLIGARWGDDIGNTKYDIYLQHGSGNSPVDVSVNMEGEVRPIIAEQTAISGMLQKPLGEDWMVRLGVAGYFQSGYGDFTVGVVELERIWENVLQDGDSLFLELGAADVWETESGNDIPGLDIRRIYEGGTALATIEYAVDDWTFKIKGAYNTKNHGMYVAPEVVWLASDSVEASLKYEAIDGEASAPSPADNPWSQYSDCDRVMGIVRFKF